MNALLMNVTRPAPNPPGPERRHVAGLNRSDRVSRQHAGAPPPRM
jgi:hypothetical protein